jgi:putative transcriptional regulator
MWIHAKSAGRWSAGRRLPLGNGSPRGRLLAGILCALLLLSGSSEPTSGKGPDPVTAIFLTAQGIPAESDFSESIVLVMNNLGPAPVGIVVNRPTRIAIADIFPDLRRLAQLPDKVYFGGPVELDTVWFLFRADKPPAHAIRTFDDVYVSGDRDLLMRLLARDKPTQGLRIFIGHAGWAPGQLEAEIDGGSWTLGRAEADAIFNGKSEIPWPSSPESKSRV